MIPLPFLPVVDGVLLPDHPLAAVANGAAAGIDLLIGTNRDELTLFGLGNPALMALDEDGVTRWVANAVPDMSGAEVIDAYRSARRARGESIEPNDIWVAVGTDIVFRWPSLQLAAAHVARGSRVYVYLFDWESPAFGGILRLLPRAGAAVRVRGGAPAGGAGLLRGRPGRRDALGADAAGVARLRRAPATRATTASAAGVPGIRRRATMIFGADTRLEDAPRNEELAVLERHRPLVSGVPGLSPRAPGVRRHRRPPTRTPRRRACGRWARATTRAAVSRWSRKTPCGKPPEKVPRSVRSTCRRSSTIGPSS